VSLFLRERGFFSFSLLLIRKIIAQKERFWIFESPNTLFTKDSCLKRKFFDSRISKNTLLGSGVSLIQDYRMSVGKSKANRLTLKDRQTKGYCLKERLKTNESLKKVILRQKTN